MSEEANDARDGEQYTRGCEVLEKECVTFAVRNCGGALFWWSLEWTFAGLWWFRKGITGKGRSDSGTIRKATSAKKTSLERRGGRGGVAA